VLTKNEINDCPKDDHPRRENLNTQPLNKQKVFNEPFIITKGWYPLCASNKLKNKSAKSFTLLKQRIVLFRGENGIVSALDSFCPHMGADLGNGEVIGNKLQCFFHHWQFSNEGKLSEDSCSLVNKDIKLNNYPTTEKYGFIWVHSSPISDHDVPSPPALKGDHYSYHFKNVKLFAHHHVMMTNGIDLQHFKSVHNLDIHFDFQIEEGTKGQFVWKLSGEIPRTSLFTKFAHYILGGKFNYEVLFDGGTITSISYGVNQKFRGTGFNIPAIHILWGATPLNEGVSAVDIFFIVRKYGGFFGLLKSGLMYLFTLIVLSILKDDDIKAFPHMRYNVGNLTPEDHSLAKFIALTNQLEVSQWTNNE
jgi:nitrite reductase/ring-hydroxylating ferredoxin subunit